MAVFIALEIHCSENKGGLSISGLREKERDLTQSYDKSPYADRKIKNATWQQKYATKNFGYTPIADQLRTISWGNDSHPTAVVKPVYGIPTFHLTAQAVLSKGHTFKKVLLSLIVSWCTDLKNSSDMV